MPGPLLFARYAYPPNALGYCGPGDSDGFLGLAVGGRRPEGPEPAGGAIRRGVALPAAHRGVQRHRRAARSPESSRPTGPGNELVTRVPTSALVTSLDDRFERRAGPQLEPRGVGRAGGRPTTQLPRLRRLPVARTPAGGNGRATAGGPGPLPHPLGPRRGRDRRSRDGAQPTTVLRRLTIDSRARTGRGGPAQLRRAGLHHRPPSPATPSPCTGIGCVTGCRRPRCAGSGTARGATSTPSTPSPDPAPPWCAERERSSAELSAGSYSSGVRPTSSKPGAYGPNRRTSRRHLHHRRGWANRRRSRVGGTITSRGIPSTRGPSSWQGRSWRGTVVVAGPIVVVAAETTGSKREPQQPLRFLFLTHHSSPHVAPPVGVR